MACLAGEGSARVSPCVKSCGCFVHGLVVDRRMRNGWTNPRRHVWIRAVQCIAIDVGTSDIKAALVDLETGRFSQRCSRRVRTFSSRSGWVEQRPSEWWDATVLVINELIHRHGGNKDVSAVSVTGQMQDLILVNKESDGALNDVAILYSDQRAVAEAEELTKVVQCTIQADSLPAKMLWIDRHWSPTTPYAHSHVLFGAADYIVWRLSGTIASDPTTASTTSLTTAAGRAYDSGLLEKASLSHWLPMLPEILCDTSSRRCGVVQQNDDLPHLVSVPVIHAGGDLASATVGAGAAKPGCTYLYIGTSGWLAGTARENSKYSEASTVFFVGHPDKDLEIRAASTTTAGGCLTWIKALLGLEWDELNDIVKHTSPGASGVFFHPHLAGERCPFVDPLARGAFSGLALTTDRSALVRAVMEGVAFNLRGALDELTRTGLPIQEDIYVVGGVVNSPAWLEILSSTLGCRLHVLRDGSAVGARGAAAIAAVALDIHSDLTLPSHWTQICATYEPTHMDTYSVLRRSWSKVYPRTGNA